MNSQLDNGGRRRLWRSRWAAIGAAVAVSLGGGGVFLVNAAASSPSAVITIDPVRILDTRDPVNVGLPGPFVSAVSQKLIVAGPVATTTGSQTVVPIGATGVLLNVTATGSTANGFISIRPGDATGAPATSSLNVTAGITIPNAVTVALPTAGASAGSIDITWDALGVAGPTTDVMIDVVGYLVAGAPGPTGPAGANGVSGIVVRVAPLTAFSGKTTGSAQCNAGEVATGGGFYWTNVPTQPMYVIDQAAATGATVITTSGGIPNRWFVEVYNGSGSTQPGTVQVICAIAGTPSAPDQGATEGDSTGRP